MGDKVVITVVGTGKVVHGGGRAVVALRPVLSWVSWGREPVKVLLMEVAQ